MERFQRDPDRNGQSHENKNQSRSQDDCNKNDRTKKKKKFRESQQIIPGKPDDPENNRCAEHRPHEILEMMEMAQYRDHQKSDRKNCRQKPS